jgi:DNA-binding MarR family transcriptional regulator
MDLPPLRMGRRGNDMRNEILKAFHHKGRKKFVPWLVSELARKMKRDPDLVINALKGLAQEGMAKSAKAMRGHDRSIWELTKAGQAEATSIMLAEEMVRSR